MPGVVPGTAVGCRLHFASTDQVLMRYFRCFSVWCVYARIYLKMCNYSINDLPHIYTKTPPKEKCSECYASLEAGGNIQKCLVKQLSVTLNARCKFAYIYRNAIQKTHFSLIRTSFLLLIICTSILKDKM